MLEGGRCWEEGYKREKKLDYCSSIINQMYLKKNICVYACYVDSISLEGATQN